MQTAIHYRSFNNYVAYYAKNFEPDQILQVFDLVDSSDLRARFNLFLDREALTRMGCYSSNGSTFSLFWFLQTEVLGEPPESLNLSSGASESWGDKLAIKLQFDPLCGHPGKLAGFLMGLETLDHVDLPLLRSEITHILQSVSGTKSNVHFRFVKEDKYYLLSVLVDSVIAQVSTTPLSHQKQLKRHLLWQEIMAWIKSSLKL